MGRLTCLLIAVLLALTALPATSFAANDTPDTAIQLSADNPVLADRLVGNTGGVARFYRINYPGNGQPVNILVTAVPGTDTTYRWFGFKMYGPNGLVGEATVKQNDHTSTTYGLSMASSTSGSYLIQVYNFSNQIAVDFKIQVAGLVGATTVAGSPAPAADNTSPDRPIGAGQPSTTASGSLTGKPGGVSQYFTVEYPGGFSALTVNMRYNPPAPCRTTPSASCSGASAMVTSSPGAARTVATPRGPTLRPATPPTPGIGCSFRCSTTSPTSRSTSA